MAELEHYFNLILLWAVDESFILQCTGDTQVISAAQPHWNMSEEYSQDTSRFKAPLIRQIWHLVCIIKEKLVT